MTTDDFYWYASVVIFLPWALLIFLPRGRYTELVAPNAKWKLSAAREGQEWQLPSR